MESGTIGREPPARDDSLGRESVAVGTVVGRDVDGAFVDEPALALVERDVAVFASAFGFRFRRLRIVVRTSSTMRSKSMASTAASMPSDWAPLTVSATFARWMSFFEGLHPRLRQVPPSRSRSTSATSSARFGGRRGDDIACATAEDDEVVFGHLRSRYQVTSAFVCWCTPAGGFSASAPTWYACTWSCHPVAHHVAGRVGSEVTQVPEGAYTPIEAYGVVGNLETCALVAPDGSVDWFPFPHVESPSILGAILDADGGGRFQISPVGEFQGSQAYVERTNVLETTFRTDGGTATVTDFPPAGRASRPPEESPLPQALVYGRDRRRRRQVRTEVRLRPHGDGHHRNGQRRPRGGRSGADVAGEPGRPPGTRRTGDRRTLPRRRRHRVVHAAMHWRRRRVDRPDAALADTVDYWNDWVHNCDGTPGDCVFDGPWHDLVVRSGLVLKLLTHAESGAIAAAPTTSLPEEVGGVRNWDYRYNWVRDAGFTIQALMNLGHVGEATDYFDWFLDLCHVEEPEDIRPLYGLHGDDDLVEREHSTTWRVPQLTARPDRKRGRRTDAARHLRRDAAARGRRDALLRPGDGRRGLGRIREIVDYVVEGGTSGTPGSGRSAAGTSTSSTRR